MRLLLDTHAFLWAIADDKRLSTKARRAIEDTRNDVNFSVVSAWEIIAKTSVGRLTLSESADKMIPKHIAASGFSVLGLTLTHALATATLPLHHRDPFDRMLVAQALTEDLTVVSGDEAIGKYDVKVMW